MCIEWRIFRCGTGEVADQWLGVGMVLVLGLIWHRRGEQGKKCIIESATQELMVCFFAMKKKKGFLFVRKGQMIEE